MPFKLDLFTLTWVVIPGFVLAAGFIGLVVKFQAFAF